MVSEKSDQQTKSDLDRLTALFCHPVEKMRQCTSDSRRTRYPGPPEHCLQSEKVLHSPSGNRTPVSRVTGGDTHHYTNEEMFMLSCRTSFITIPVNIQRR
ncbi:hypothetical protein WMY93_022244 [Mugilogobius chulae]|uniref:Uncharacterized protein n=1 Tax=Mugilogobius chulae TaxID=88201 RepID=A0AAW0NAW9_9GOBI